MINLGKGFLNKIAYILIFIIIISMGTMGTVEAASSG